MTAQNLLKQALLELCILKKGERFIVKDLFKGHIWNKQNKSERLLLGTLFLNYAKQNLSHFKILQKTTSGQQEYELIKKYEMPDIFIYDISSQVHIFEKTNQMKISKLQDFIVVQIGTSGLDLYEMALKEDIDFESLSTILKKSIDL